MLTSHRAAALRLAAGPLSRALLILLTLLATSCAHLRATNLPLEQVDPNGGYRQSVVINRNGAGDMILLLAFSGGGTRAAALSYGVLQELRDTSVMIDGEMTRLIDEVDLITSVSGGSFTAAYYALHGERTFEDYESRFLKRHVSRDLLLRALDIDPEKARAFRAEFEEEFIHKRAARPDEDKESKDKESKAPSGPREILGVPRDATPDECKAAFKKLAMALHPDRNYDASPDERRDNEAKFKAALNALEEILQKSGPSGD